MGNLITGLDIGSAYIKGVVVEERKRGEPLSVLSVFKHPSFGFRKGVCVDAEDATHVLRDVMIELKNISKRATDNIIVNINGSQMKVRRSKGTVVVARADQKIQQDDIDRAKSAASAVKLSPNYTLLHTIVREYIVDDIGDVLHPVGMSGNKLEVDTLLVEAFEPQMRSLLEIIERVGGMVGGIIFNPFAEERAVLSKRQKDLGVLLVDIGASTTSFVIYEEGKPISAKVFPVGSAHITNDIAIGFKIPIDAAERIKTLHGTASTKEVSRREVIQLSEFDEGNSGEASKHFLAEIIEVRLDEIFNFITDEMKSKAYLRELPAGVVLVGGGSKLSGIIPFAKHVFKLPAQIGYPYLNQLEISDTGHEDSLDSEDFVTALGLVLWRASEDYRPVGIGMGAVKSFIRNLLP